MLTRLHIRNFTIVDELDLDLMSGLTVLTGETGAGKSIVLDALGLALGDRGDSSTVRQGCERSEITAVFDISQQPGIRDWLRERELDSDDECHLRRTLGSDGRSRGFINGQPQPLQVLRECGEMLVDIHGQHAHQALLRRDMQRQILDDYAGNGEILQQLTTVYHDRRRLLAELETLREEKGRHDARLDLLRYQVQELEALNLLPDELTQLEEDHQRLAHASRLLEASQETLHLLQENEQGALLSMLQRSTQQLEHLHQYDARLTPITDLLSSAGIQLKEAVDELRDYQDSVELDPQQLHAIEQRLSDIQDIARKHHCRPEDLAELLATLTAELQLIETHDIRSGQLEQEAGRLTEEYRTIAGNLSKARAKTATSLSARVSNNMHRLGMTGGSFEIALTALDEGESSPGGMERVEFLVSTNKGQPAQPLHKIASGGELSRISLALQVITSTSHGIATLIFDEVDVGIGGGTAEIVGHMLRQLGEHRQVLCVTHQPQVAALGQHHLHVSKKTEGGSTIARIVLLPQKQRIDEIARMLGGLRITEQTLAHAQEMLEQSQHVPLPA